MTNVAAVAYEFGPFRLHGAQRLLVRAGAPVHLRPLEFDILLYVVQRPMQLITITALKRDVWKGTAIVDSDVRTHVSRLRTALGDKQPWAYLDTVQKSQGYRFVAAVRCMACDGHDPVDPFVRDAAHPPCRVIRSAGEVIAENLAIAREARNFLVATGSRSRDVAYLNAIATALRDNPRLVHYRILFGMPHNPMLFEHLRHLLEIRDPTNREHGMQTLHIGMYENYIRGEPERFICANEYRALIALPSVTGFGHYDTALVLRDWSDVDGIWRFARELYVASTPLETLADIDRLDVLRRSTKQT